MTDPVRMSVEAPCVVCGEPVKIRPGFEGDALCIADFFSDDPTEDWERDDDQG